MYLVHSFKRIRLLLAIFVFMDITVSIVLRVTAAVRFLTNLFMQLRLWSALTLADVCWLTFSLQEGLYIVVATCIGFILRYRSNEELSIHECSGRVFYWVLGHRRELTPVETSTAKLYTSTEKIPLLKKTTGNVIVVQNPQTELYIRSGSSVPGDIAVGKSYG